MAEQPKALSDKELQAPIGARGDDAYQVLANETGRRVYTVLDNMVDVRSRASKGVLHGEEVTAILMGSISGIANMVARMKIEGPSEEGAPPAEIALLNDLGNQFLYTIKQMRESDPVAKMMAGASVEDAGVKPS